MTLNTKSVVKRLEILKLSDSCNIVGVVDSTQYIVHSILNFLTFFVSHFLKD